MNYFMELRDLFTYIRVTFKKGLKLNQRSKKVHFDISKRIFIKQIGSWWGNQREGNHWRDLGIDGWIILGWISRRWDVGIWTGLGWPRIETGGGRL